MGENRTERQQEVSFPRVTSAGKGRQPESFFQLNQRYFPGTS